MAYSLDADDSSLFVDAVEMNNLKSQIQDLTKNIKPGQSPSRKIDEKEENLIENYIVPRATSKAPLAIIKEDKYEKPLQITLLGIHLFSNGLAIPLLYKFAMQTAKNEATPVFWKFSLMSIFYMVLTIFERSHNKWNLHTIFAPVNLLSIIVAGVSFALWNLFTLHFMIEGSSFFIIFGSSLVSIFCLIHSHILQYFF